MLGEMAGKIEKTRRNLEEILKKSVTQQRMFRQMSSMIT